MNAYYVEFQDAGDAMYFDSTVPHGYQREGRKNARAVVVTSPDGRLR